MGYNPNCNEDMSSKLIQLIIAEQLFEVGKLED